MNIGNINITENNQITSSPFNSEICNLNLRSTNSYEFPSVNSGDPG